MGDFRQKATDLHVCTMSVLTTFHPDALQQHILSLKKQTNSQIIN